MSLNREDVIRYAYVDNANGETSPAFFAYPIRLGTNGVEKFYLSAISANLKRSTRAVNSCIK